MMRIWCWIIVGLFILAFLPLLAAERTEVKVFIPNTGPDSLLAESLEEQVRMVNPLMGQVIINNSRGTILGYVTDVDSLLADTLILRVLAGPIKVNVRKIEKPEPSK